MEVEQQLPILEVNHLFVSFKQYDRGWRQRKVNVIHNLSLTVERGEVLAVIGSSGSGKSLLAHALLGILPSNATMTGEIHYDGEELSKQRIVELRGREIALVPQSVNYLDPLMKVGRQVRYSANMADAASEQKHVFERFGLEPDAAELYPFQLSGGMARRVLVSTAAVSGARLIIADEPTPGLDPVSVQAALNDFRELANQGSAVIIISHDIEAALTVADKVAVFYAGTTVEVARKEEFTGNGERLRHPYTQALWRALPQNGFIPLAGEQPHPSELPPGCVFAPRCQLANADCSERQPEERILRGGTVRCIHAT